MLSLITMRDPADTPPELPLELILAIALFVGVAVVLPIVGFSIGMVRERRARGPLVLRVTESAPRIAYKKAFLQPPGAAKHFKGVYMGAYSAVDVAQGVGFHAYSSITDAIAHPQEGNVLLEVVLSGVMDKRDLGYVAEKQRVLQVIPYTCYVCDGKPSACLTAPNELFFVCRLHGARGALGQKFSQFFARLPFAAAIYPYTVTSLEALPTLLPWLADEKVVVSTLSGKHEFVPTKEV